MDASIVIPTKNAGKKFEDVLKILFSQKTDLDYEVICVDSGSKDSTIELIEKYPVKLFNIDNTEFGHGKTRNYGASKAQGDYIVFITQDALPASENWLDNFIKAMQVDKDIVGGFGRHLPYPDCNLFDKNDINNLFKSFGKENTLFYIEDKERYKNDESYVHYLSFFSDNNSCVRKSVFLDHPYDDVEFAEDQIWMKKMIELGYKKVYCPDASVYHSHNYPIRTYYKRYYDEHKGLYEVFGYRNSKSYFKLFYLWPKHFLIDIKNTIIPARVNLIKKFKLICYSIARNYCRYFAGFKGGKWHELDKKKQLIWDKKYSQQYNQRNS